MTKRRVEIEDVEDVELHVGREENVELCNGYQLTVEKPTI